MAQIIARTLDESRCAITVAGSREEVANLFGSVIRDMLDHKDFTQEEILAFALRAIKSPPLQSPNRYVVHRVKSVVSE